MSTNPILRHPTAAEAIEFLYQESEARRPTLGRRIVPLKRLLTACPLNCVEMPRLSRGAAFRYFSADAAEAPVVDAGDLELLAGFLYASPRAGTIFVEQTDSVTRRRFTVAHELGHYLLHLRPFFQSLEPGDEAPIVAIADLHRDDDGEFGLGHAPDASRQGDVEVMGEADGGGLLPPHEVMEREADEFASELLMPEALLRELIANGFAELRDMDLVWRLAADMLVSVAAMSRRLSDLGIISAR